MKTQQQQGAMTETAADDTDAAAARIEALMSEKAAGIFQLCDRESKGFLTRADMRRLDTELPLSADQLEQVFDLLDDNGNGFLTQSEFASGFGHFLGLTVCNTRDMDTRLQSTVYESDVDNDVTDASDQFDDMMRNLGAVGLLENEDVIKSIWLRLRNQPELLDNFEMLLRRLTSELQRSHVDYYALQKTFTTNSWEHDEEMMQLYEEMERHINGEKKRLEQEEKAKELRLKEFMENELENKDKQLEKLAVRQQELEQKLAELKQQQSQTRAENVRLIKEKEEMEERLEHSGDGHRHSVVNSGGLNSGGLSDRDARSFAAVQIVEWIELERENLLRQLHMLRETNRELRDYNDETTGGLRHQRFKPNSLNSSRDETADISSASILHELSRSSIDAVQGSDCRLRSTDADDEVDIHRDDPQVPAAAAAEHVFKIVFVGDSGVGKTCFIYRFCRNSFRAAFTTTIGVDFQVKSVKVDGRTVVLQLWDTAGQERYRSFTRHYFRKADGILVIYDVTSAPSFHNVRDWMNSIQESIEDGAVVMILANKLDLVEDDQTRRAVSTEAGHALAAEYEALFYETSAKSGHNIDTAITTMTRLLQKRQTDKLCEAYSLTVDKVNKKSCC